MFHKFSTSSLFFVPIIFFNAANAVPLRERIVFPTTRETASEVEFNGFVIEPPARTRPGNDIPSDTASPKTTTFNAPSPVRTLGVFSRANPNGPVFLSVIEETSNFADISTALFVVSSTDAIQPTPTDTNTNDPKGSGVITNYQAEPTATGVTFDSIASVDTQVASSSEPLEPSPSNSGNDFQPTPTETLANDPKGSEDITIVQAEPTATDITFDSTSVVTRVASVSEPLEPTSSFSGNPSTTFTVENGAVIGAVITNAPTGIASPEDASQTEDSGMISEDQLPVGQKANKGAVKFHTTGVDRKRPKKDKKDKQH